MGYTHFPYGVSSFGAPIMPGYVVPNLPAGKRPAGAAAGYNGVQFVDGTNGSDANDGLTPNTALLHLDTAYNNTLGGFNEIIYVMGSSTAVNFTSSVTTSGFTMSKNYTHVIGLNNGCMIGQRSRITNGASTTLMTPMLKVSGIGSMFMNLEIANLGDDATGAAVPLLVTGVRNSFINCQISGGFTSATAGNAAMRSLVIGASTPTAADENYFNHCYIGLDTIARTSTQTEVEILGGSARVVFENCYFSTYTSAGNNFFVKVGASGIDRFLMFKNCQFLNATTLSGGVALSNAFSWDGAAGGLIMLTGCLINGATATSATKTVEFGDNAYAAATTAKAVNLSW